MSIRNLLSLVAASAALCSAVPMSPALATTYDFSYQFLDGGAPGGSPGTDAGLVTGSFTGSGPIDDITSISNISMSLNGTAMTGPFYAWSYNAPANVDGFPGNFTYGNALVSNDPTKNDFLFTNAANGSPVPGNYFYIIQPWNNPGPGSTTIAAQLSNSGTVIDTYNGQYVTGNWNVSAVPEPSTWAMLLMGFAGLGFVAHRRTKLTGSVKLSAA